MSVKGKKEEFVKKVIQHRIADIRGGVGVRSSTLGGDYFFEGTPLGAPTSGLADVVKFATLVTQAANSATNYEVAKGHHFKVGDVVMSAEGAKAYAITAIDKTTNAAKDIITLATTLGVVVNVGEHLMEAAAVTAGTDSALKVVPQTINGTNQPVGAKENIFTDAWLIAVTTDKLPAAILSKLKGIHQI